MIQSHLKAAGRFFTVFLLLVAVMQAAYAVIRLIPFVPEGYEPSRVGAWVGAAAALVLFFLLVRTATLYDRPLRKRYAESGGNRPLRFLLCGVRFWAETAGFALLCLLLPSGWLFAGLPVLLPDRGLCLALLLPLLFLLQLPARLSAFRAFGRMNESREPYAERKAYRGALTRIALGCALGAIGAELLARLCFGVWPALSTILTPGVLAVLLPLLGALLLLPPAFRLLRAWRKRRSFLKKLKAVCAEKGYALSEIRRPYASLLFLTAGEDFSLQMDGRRYSCKLVCARRRGTPMTVRENGVCAFEHTIRLTKIELFTYETQIAFGYEAADKKVLIVNPVPKVLQKDEQTKTVPLDNGDTVGGSIVYAATGFLNALGRGRLGR